MKLSFTYQEQVGWEAGHGDYCKSYLRDDTLMERDYTYPSLTQASFRPSLHSNIIRKGALELRKQWVMTFSKTVRAIKYDYNKVSVFRFSNFILRSAVKCCAIFNLKNAY